MPKNTKNLKKKTCTAPLGDVQVPMKQRRSKNSTQTGKAPVNLIHNLTRFQIKVKVSHGKD
jgi:hypothetical protein